MAPGCQFYFSYRSVFKATVPQTCALCGCITGKLKYINRQKNKHIEEVGREIKIYGIHRQNILQKQVHCTNRNIEQVYIGELKYIVEIGRIGKKIQLLIEYVWEVALIRYYDAIKLNYFHLMNITKVNLCFRIRVKWKNP